MTEPKLCKDCRWAKNTYPDYKPSNPAMLELVWSCQHPSATIPAGPPSPVTGAVAPAFQRSCAENRGYSRDMCGPEGQFWEPIGFT